MREGDIWQDDERVLHSATIGQFLSVHSSGLFFKLSFLNWALFQCCFFFFYIYLHFFSIESFGPGGATVKETERESERERKRALLPWEQKPSPVERKNWEELS